MYTEALNQALQNTDGLTAETTLEIQLKYMNGGWYMVTDRSLMNALVGGES